MQFFGRKVPQIETKTVEKPKIFQFLSFFMQCKLFTIFEGFGGLEVSKPSTTKQLAMHYAFFERKLQCCAAKTPQNAQK